MFSARDLGSVGVIVVSRCALVSLAGCRWEAPDVSVLRWMEDGDGSNGIQHAETYRGRFHGPWAQECQEAS